MSHTLPPFNQPRLNRPACSDSPSPDENTFDSFSGGIALIISRLDRRPNDPNAAVRQFIQLYPQIVAHYLQSAPQQYLPPFGLLSLTPGDKRNSVDFILVALNDQVPSTPRPDILDSLKLAVLHHGQFNARWTTGNGPDKTRRGFFKMESTAAANRLKPRLETALTQRGCTFQNSAVTTHAYAGPRLAVDFLDPDSLDRLTETPLVLNHVTYPVSRPRFIEPEFGYDVAITGCGGIQGFEACMNVHICRHMGDVIAGSRMALGGDTYVVVLKTWELTSQLLSQPLPHPRGLPTHIKLSDPILLYFFNACGCPASPQYLTSTSPTPSPDTVNLQKQIDLLREQGVQCLTITNNLIDSQSTILHDIRLSNMQMRSALTASANCQTAASRLSSVESDLSQLRSQLDMKQTMLMVVTDPAMRSALTAQADAIMVDIEAKRQLRIEAEQHVMSLMGSMHAAIAYSESPDDGPPVNPPDHDSPHEQGPSQRQRVRESSPSEEDTVRSSLMPVDDSEAV